ncbi:MAG: hypothetical protein ACOCYZ_03910 [Halococcoides sp.]
MIADWTAVAVALAVPIAVLAVVTARSPPGRDRLAATLALAGLAPLSIAPVLYWLARRGHWTVEPAPLGRIGSVPLAALGVVAAGALFAGLLVWRIGHVDARPEVSRTDRVWGAIAGLAIAVVGVVLAVRSNVVVGVTLVWAGPLLAGQWALDWRVCWARRRSVAWAVVVPVLSLWAIDRVAISGGTPIGGWGPSIEGMVLSTVGTLLVVQSLVLVDRYA